jgi:DNA-binding transcriptional LysR family regulator
VPDFLGQCILSDANRGIDQIVFEHLRIRQLQLLVEIAEKSSLVNAARALNMTQPAATKSLRQLEELFGAPLVIRGHRGSELTALGQGLYEHAKAILATVRTANMEVRDYIDGNAGMTRVGVLPVALPVLVPQTIKLLQQLSPGMVVRATTGDTSFLLDMLKLEKIDFLVGRVWLAEDPEIESQALYSSAFSLVVRNGHPIFSEPNQTLAEAVKFDWVMPPSGSQGRIAVDAALAAQGAPAPRFMVETISYVLTRELLRESDMIAPMDRATLVKDIQHGMLRVVDIELGTQLPPIGFMSLRDRPWSPAGKRFVECLTRTARNLS